MFRHAACFARLMKRLRGQGRSQEEAEDLIQEAFLRLQEYCARAAVKNEEAFLVHTVGNLAIDHYRRERVLSRATETLEELQGTPALVDGAPSPERILAAQQRLEEISKALSAVSARTCEIFLAQRAGFSYHEIAAELNISQRTVQKHIARAMYLLMRLKAREPE